MDVALVTRAPDHALLEPLVADPRIRLHLLASESFTIFRHRHVDGERRLELESRAADIAAADIPPPWRDQPCVFLVPVIGECDTALLTAFPESELIVGAQGWLRAIPGGPRQGAVGADRPVRPCAPPDALLAARLLALTLSEEDHPEAEALARRLAENCRLVALTRGEKALTVFEQNGEFDVAIEPVKQARDTTGAGDVFTALLGLGLIAGQTVRAAACDAARGAGRFVAEGMAGLAF